MRFIRTGLCRNPAGIKQIFGKIFLDQIYICIVLAVNGWDHIGLAVKNGNREKIRALLQKAKHYILLI